MFTCMCLCVCFVSIVVVVTQSAVRKSHNYQHNSESNFGEQYRSICNLQYVSNGVQERNCYCLSPRLPADCSTEHIGPNGSARSSATCSLASSRDSSTCTVPYRVIMLGGAGVGKSSLVQQFMTSEYLHAYDLSLGESRSRIIATHSRNVIWLDETKQ